MRDKGISSLEIIITLKGELGLRSLFLGSYETFGRRREIVRHLVVTVRNPWPRINDKAMLLFPDIPTVINNRMLFKPSTQNIFKLMILPADEEDVRGINWNLIKAALSGMDVYAEKLLSIQ